MVHSKQIIQSHQYHHCKLDKDHQQIILSYNSGKGLTTKLISLIPTQNPDAFSTLA